MRPSILMAALAAIFVLGLAVPAQAGFVKSGVAYYVELVADRCQDGGALDYLGTRNQTCDALAGTNDIQKTVGPVFRNLDKQWMEWILTKTGTASNRDDLVTFRTKAPESARCSGFMLPENKDTCDDKFTRIHPKSTYVWRLTPVPNTKSFLIIAASRSPQCRRFLGGSKDCNNKFASLFPADDGSGYQRWKFNPVPVAGLKIAAKETGPTSAVVEITSTGEPIPTRYKCTYSTSGTAAREVTVPATGTSATVPLTGLTASSTYSVTCVGLDAAKKPIAEPATTSFTTPSGDGPGISAKPAGPTAGEVTLTNPPGVDPVSYKCAYSTSQAAAQEATVPATGTSTTVTLTGLTASTTYSVTCVGLDAAGKPITEPSTGSLTTPNAATVPDAPTSVIATVNPTNACVTVTWQAPLDNVSPVTGYNVECLSTGGASIGSAYYSGGATTTTAGGPYLCGVLPEVGYTCTVSAVNSAGSSVPSTLSNEFMVIIIDSGDAPRPLPRVSPPPPKRPSKPPPKPPSPPPPEPPSPPPPKPPSPPPPKPPSPPSPPPRPPPPPPASWVIVGNAGFSAGSTASISLALDSSGNPFVAYIDGANNNKATVMKFTSASKKWKPVGSAGFSAGEAASTSLALDSSGNPFVAYQDVANGGKATVMKYTSASGWEPVGSAGFSAGEAQYTRLALDSSGNPFVSFKDGANGGKATVMKYTSASGWEPVGIAGFSAEVVFPPSLALDSSGNPFVSYSDVDNNYKATVMKYTSASGWETVGNAGFSAGQVSSISLALDSSGNPFVAYQDGANNYKATTMKYTSASGLETVGNAGFSAGGAFFTSLALDSSGNPFVVYLDGENSDKATVMTYTSASGWEPVGSAGFSAGVALFTSLALDSSENPFVAYLDNDNKPTVEKYA